MYTTSSLANELRDKEYRDAFVASQIKIGLPLQCRALREQRGWTQPRLAEIAGMSQPRISEIERPGERRLNIDTLLRLASAFDIALQIQFVPFSKIADFSDTVDLDLFNVKSFDDDMEDLAERETRAENALQGKRFTRDFLNCRPTISALGEPPQPTGADSQLMGGGGNNAIEFRIAS